MGGYSWASGLEPSVWKRIGKRISTSLELDTPWPFWWPEGHPPEYRETLGQGFYGVVVPTRHPDWVLKVTADLSEGPLWQLVRDDLELKKLEALPRVRGVWKLDARRPDRGYAILREYLHPVKSLGITITGLLGTIRGIALDLNNLTPDDGYEWRDCVEQFTQAVQALGRARPAQTSELVKVFEGFWTRHGIALADVHASNLATRYKETPLVVFDLGGTSSYPAHLAETIEVANPGTPVGIEWESVQGHRRVLAVQSFGGRDVAIVQTGDLQTGHTIIPVDSLEKEMDLETRQYQSRQKMQAAAAAQQSIQEAQAKAVSTLDGFEKTLTPKTWGVAVRALTTKGVNSDGRFYPSIRDLIRARVAEGWCVIGDGASRRFTGPDGCFLFQKDITKIGMDYAAYLSSPKANPGTVAAADVEIPATRPGKGQGKARTSRTGPGWEAPSGSWLPADQQATLREESFRGRTLIPREFRTMRGYTWSLRVSKSDWTRIAKRVSKALGIKGWPFPWRDGTQALAGDILGSGAFGIVVPTIRPGWVVKVTADPSEGPIWGLVKDHPVISKLPGLPTVLGVWKIPSIEGFAILREDLLPVLHVESRTNALYRLRQVLTQCYAENNYERAWLALSALGEKYPELADVADAIRVLYHAAGIVLLDVHGGNVGLRPGGRKLVILDIGASEGHTAEMLQSIEVANPR